MQQKKSKKKQNGHTMYAVKYERKSKEGGQVCDENTSSQPALVIKNAEFITSAARTDQFITPDKPMIAVCGKSNVGKSSFINMLANNSKLAKVSATQGKTKLVNFFKFKL